MEDIILELPRLIKDRVKGQKYRYNNMIRIWNGSYLVCIHNKKLINCNLCQFIPTNTIDNIINLNDDENQLENLPRLIKDRVNNTKYIYLNKIVIWRNNKIHCEHNKLSYNCDICKNNNTSNSIEIDTTTLLLLPDHIKDRIKNNKYISNNRIVIWTGKELHCEHNRRPGRCNLCKNNNNVTIVNNIENLLSSNNSIPYLPKYKKNRIDNTKYLHNDKIILWNGISIICEHNILLYSCKKCCNQDKLCEHKKLKGRCKQCGGGSFCEHNKERYRCEKCNPEGHIVSVMRSRMSMALKRESKSESTIELLGCNMEDFLQYLEKQFDDNMTFENYGDYWHVDHIKPCASFDLKNEEEQKKCFHYTNLQPMEGKENMSKGSKYDDESFNRYWKNDIEGWIDK